MNPRGSERNPQDIADDDLNVDRLEQYFGQGNREVQEAAEILLRKSLPYLTRGKGVCYILGRPKDY